MTILTSLQSLYCLKLVNMLVEYDQCAKGSHRHPSALMSSPVCIVLSSVYATRHLETLWVGLHLGFELSNVPKCIYNI